ncbi:MAG: SpoIIE family protein phosphatase [bacterium]|nr:SpoIIE family protein phosphatase [bacterium]
MTESILEQRDTELEQRDMIHQQEAGGLELSRVAVERPIFSAYEVGKTARTAAQLSETTGGQNIVLHEDTRTAAVHDMYQDFPEMDYLPVENSAGRITGYVRRQMFFAALSQNQFMRDLLLKPDMTVAGIMDPRVVCLDSHTRLPEASEVLMNREDEVRFDPFVITHEGEFYGISSVRRVLDALNFYFKQDLIACDCAQRSVMQTGGFGASANEVLQATSKVMPLTGPGGDYAAVFDLDERLTLMVLFDVCGKGLKASQMVATIASAIRTMLEFDRRPEERDLLQFDLGEKLHRLNRLIYDINPEGMYATGVAMLFDRSRKVMQLFDFGHSLVWLKRKNKIYNLCESVEFYSSGGVPFFGIDPDLKMRGKSFQLRAGDALFVCSDGINEAKNRDKEEFGTDAIVQSLLAPGVGNEPAAIISQIETVWNEFRGGYRQLDDVSMLAATVA